MTTGGGRGEREREDGENLSVAEGARGREANDAPVRHHGETRKELRDIFTLWGNYIICESKKTYCFKDFLLPYIRFLNANFFLTCITNRLIIVNNREQTLYKKH